MGFLDSLFGGGGGIKGITDMLGVAGNSAASYMSTEEARKTIAEANREAAATMEKYYGYLDRMNSTDYTKQAAIADTSAQIDQIFKEYRQTSLPSIYNRAISSGGYNQTSAQLLANDAYSSAVAKGQAQIVENIMRYAQADKWQQEPVLALMQNEAGIAAANRRATADQYGSLASQAAANKGQYDDIFGGIGAIGDIFGGLFGGDSGGLFGGSGGSSSGGVGDAIGDVFSDIDWGTVAMIALKFFGL